MSAHSDVVHELDVTVEVYSHGLHVPESASSYFQTQGWGPNETPLNAGGPRAWQVRTCIQAYASPLEFRQSLKFQGGDVLTLELLRLGVLRGAASCAFRSHHVVTPLRLLHINYIGVGEVWGF